MLVFARPFATLAATALLVSAGPALGADCTGTSTGLVPIDDLGASTYRGAQGGLYPGGATDRPPAHEAAGRAIAEAIEPIDGKVVMISIGMSNTTQEFSVFVELAMDHPNRNPALRVIDTAQGGQHACIAADPNSTYWDNVMTRIAQRGCTPDQVRVAWVKQAVPGPSGEFPEAELALEDKLRQIARNLTDKFPNLALAYLSSRIYAGYASTSLNPEPYAYGSGFSVKWLIEDQIAGDPALNHDPANGPVESAWLSWGPYLWADGLVPRSDGLTWSCSDFADDGTHPSPDGRQKVAAMLLEYFTTDATSTPWFLASPVDVPHASATPMLGAPRPNPFRSVVRLPVGAAAGDARADVFDAKGAWITDLRPTDGALAWDGRSRGGESVVPGVYVVVLRLASGHSSAKTILVR